MGIVPAKYASNDCLLRSAWKDDGHCVTDDGGIGRHLAWGPWNDPDAQPRDIACFNRFKDAKHGTITGN